MFLLVALLMGVTTAIFEARNPERWKWLWAFEKQQRESVDIDPRLNLKPREPRHSEEVVLGGLPVAKPAEKAEHDAEEEKLAANERAWIGGWREIDGRIANEDRRVLFELLKRNRTPPQEAKPLEKAEESLANIDSAWQDYIASSTISLKDLAEDERVAWKAVLDGLGTRWSTAIRPALTLLVEQQALTGEQKTHVTELQTVLDRIGLKKIEDDSPWRNSEREIWFRLFGQLQQRTLAELKAESEGFVSYSQLFKQSKSYRGKLVTVRGRAEAVYSLSAPKNSYGIGEYWVFWLYPEGGPNSPLVVYALTKPKDFPHITAEEVGIKPMPSPEDVEFSGYFFKRHAYQGKGGIYVAPTLIALEPEWLQATEISHPPIPSYIQAIAAVLGLAAFAVGFAAWVYYQYRPNVGREIQETVIFPTSSSQYDRDEQNS